MNILVLVHNFWKMLMICFLGFFASYLSIVYQHLLSVLCRLGVVIDGLVVNEVRIFVCVCVCVCVCVGMASFHSMFFIVFRCH